MEQLVRVADLKTCERHNPASSTCPICSRSWNRERVQREMELSVGADRDAVMSDLVAQIGRVRHGVLLDFDGLVRFGHWWVGGPAPMIDRVVAGFERVEHLDPRHWRRGD